jgi:hypothetical protein
LHQIPPKTDIDDTVTHLYPLFLYPVAKDLQYNFGRMIFVDLLIPVPLLYASLYRKYSLPSEMHEIRYIIVPAFILFLFPVVQDLQHNLIE